MAHSIPRTPLLLDDPGEHAIPALGSTKPKTTEMRFAFKRYAPVAGGKFWCFQQSNLEHAVRDSVHIGGRFEDLLVC